MTSAYIMALFLSLWLRLCCAKFFEVKFLVLETKLAARGGQL